MLLPWSECTNEVFKETFSGIFACAKGCILYLVCPAILVWDKLSVPNVPLNLRTDMNNILNGVYVLSGYSHAFTSIREVFSMFRVQT